MITQVSHSCHLLKAASPAPAFPALQQLASVVPQLSLFIALFSQALIMEGKRKLLLIVWWHGYKISCILAPAWTSHWSAGAILFACIVCAAAGIARTSVLWSWNLAPCTFTHHCELAIFFLFLNGLINTSYVLGVFFTLSFIFPFQTKCCWQLQHVAAEMFLQCCLYSCTEDVFVMCTSFVT